MSKPIGYYNHNTFPVTFGTRFGPIHLDPKQIIHRDSKGGGGLVVQDAELDAKVRQGMLKRLHEGESTSTTFFNPSRKESDKSPDERAVITSRAGYVREEIPQGPRPAPKAPRTPPPAPAPAVTETPHGVPTVRVSSQTGVQDLAATESPTPEQFMAPRPKTPDTVTIHASDYAHPNPPNKPASTSIQVDASGVPVNTTRNEDGTLVFEGAKFLGVGALKKFVEATGRPVEQVATP